jgi:hypothetical protein
MPIDPTPITGVITTDTDPTDEPSLTLTQLRALLRDAAAYERAQRPVVLHQAPETAPATAPAPVPAAVVPALMPAPVRPRPAWGVRLVYASVAALVTGAADGVFCGTAPLPVLLCAAGILGTIGGTARALTEERQGRS